MKVREVSTVRQVNKRVFLIVLDSMGIGEMPDAALFQDQGSNTLGAIRHQPEFDCPHLTSLGLFHIDGVGGGVGVPPMYRLAKELVAQGKSVSVILGFNTKSEIFYEDEFKALGCDVTVTTVDGSYGVKGFVTDALPEGYTHFCCCGPEPMLKAVYRATTTSGQMSFEERMGCGFGACMGCSCKTLTGNKRICKDGPVMKKEEILWED